MAESPHILVADDDRLIRMTLETGLSLNGFRVTCAPSGRTALEAASNQKFDGILSDVYMPDGDGMSLLRGLRSTQPHIPIILMTAQGSVDIAVSAVAEGATDFIAKPFEVEALAALLRRHLNARTEFDAQTESEIPLEDYSQSGLVGLSPAMVNVYKLIAHAARTEATVLLTGESGTGKELVARAVHQFSPRRNQAFIAINCSGLTDTLLESELFGHTRGAFTGANADRAGLFEAADGGTLFLDELATTSASFQASLLRVLQSGEVRRVGASQTRRVNVRVVGASNADLRGLAEAGNFRADLYYRLSVLTINLPPLRERVGDVELLAQHFLHRLSGKSSLHLTREALLALGAYSFPGNVRELENALTRAAALASNGMITLDCLPPYLVSSVQAEEVNTEESVRGLAADWPTMEELERRYLTLALAKVNGNRQHAATLLGLNRRTIQRLIARHQLNGEESEEEGETE